jgi:predicted phosphodiesterase
MSTYGIIADVHGNLEALTAVLAALGRCRVDKVVCLGDLVGYNGESNECVELIGSRNIEAIAGNHDLIALGLLGTERCAMRPAYTLKRTRTALAEATRRSLSALPRTRLYEERIALVHGGVDDVCEYMTTPARISENASRLTMLHPEARLCFFGHTHVPKLYELTEGVWLERAVPPEGDVLGRRDRLSFVNPGSVDAARRPTKLAEFAVFDSVRWTIAFHRVPYDHEKAERSAEEKGFRMSRAEEALYTAERWLRRGRRVAERLLGS